MLEYAVDSSNAETENEIAQLRILYDADGEALGCLVNDTLLLLYTKNILGDITGVINPENGRLLFGYAYDAYGNYKLVTKNNTLGENIAAVFLQLLNPLSYRGYAFTPAVGASHYLGSRFYSPQLCRFMNADVYADTAQGINGTNMFIYCCNNSTNMVDPLGFWGKDVHSGYYSSDKKALKIKGQNYGTYYWAKSCGFSDKNAELIAKSCYRIDTFYPAWVFSEKNQSWHFNTSKNGVDSRITLFLACLLLSIEYATLAQEKYEQGYKDKNVANNWGKALVYLGYSLHPLQDIYSHTPEVSAVKNIGTRIVFYSHLDYDDVDNAEVHSNVVLGIVREQTISVLNGFSLEYNTMIQDLTGTNYWYKLDVFVD